MAKEYDRVLFPGFLQDTLTISLGACFKSMEMLKSPQQSIETIMGEMMSLVSIPDDAGEGLVSKAQAVALAWMEKSAALVNDCKTAGQKFTEGT
jgi:hypothetical protein